jgi:hypothetical protein
VSGNLARRNFYDLAIFTARILIIAMTESRPGEMKKNGLTVQECFYYWRRIGRDGTTALGRIEALHSNGCTSLHKAGKDRARLIEADITYKYLWNHYDFFLK